MNKTKRIFGDTLTMTQRCLLLSKRNIDTFLTSFLIPALMMLLFVYVFGGAMDVGNFSYVNYIVPGIIIQCIGQCASTTAISVNSDIQKGIIDRFCTLPIRKSSILSGHVLGALLRNVLTTAIIIAVAFMVGFRPTAGLVDWLMVIMIVLLYIITISWVSVFIGIKASSSEGAGAFSVITIILPYLSSGFVPVETMPKFLRVFAEHQPMTPIIETMRTLLLGEALNKDTLFLAIVWCLGLTIVFYILSSKAFMRKIRK